MADGGSLIPNVPVSAAPIHVQMGGVNTPANDTSSVIADAGNNDRSTTNFEKNNTRSMKGQYENDRTLEEFEPNAVDVINNEVAAGPEKSTKKSTIGDDVVIDKLRAILSADKEYQTVLALLGEADPSKLRSNILFNPEYKVIADLLKQIVRFKVEQYAKGLEEVRGEGKSKDVAPAAAVGKDEAEEKPVEKTEEESEEKGEGDPVSTTVTAPEIATDASKSGSVNETRDVAQGNLLGQSPPVRSNINPALFNLPVSQDQTEDTKAKTGEGSEEKSEEKPVGEPEVKTEEKPEEKPEEKAQENPFNQFGPNTTPLSTTQVQSTGGVKSRKASRVLRKLKTTKKSKKHTVPLL